jgi:hypothetical protein
MGLSKVESFKALRQRGGMESLRQGMVKAVHDHIRETLERGQSTVKRLAQIETQLARRSVDAKR